jgi:putative RNA 2'-phosphotransferase
VEPERRVAISRMLSRALRHRPATLGIVLDAGGWTTTASVLAGLAAAGEVVTREDLVEIVRTSDKRRFALSDDGLRVRASQGHSIDVDLGLARSTPPEILFHGTSARFEESIRRSGLDKRARTHVHLSADRSTAEIVARRRRGEIVVLRIRARAMHDAGHVFVVSANGVWLTDHVPASFIDGP